MSEDNQPNQELNLEEIKNILLNLQKKFDQQENRFSALESRINNLEKPSTAKIVEAPTLVPPPPPPPLKLNAEEMLYNKSQPSSQSVRPPKIAENKGGLEEIIAGGWFAKIGITALVLGVSFFLKYAFDNNWIGETGRVIMGIMAGLILLGFGEKFIRKYFVYAQILSGGGLAFLYLSIYAAFNFYDLIPQGIAFFIMIIITAVGILLSIRYNALALIAASILGGFLTPILVSTGQNSFYSLFGYILILDLAILIVSYYKKWNALNIIGMAGTALLFFGWAEKFYTKEEWLWPVIVFLTIFYFVYSLSSVIFNLAKKEESTGVEQILSLISGALYFWICYSLLNDDYHVFMGFFAVILALYYFIWAYIIRELTPKDVNLYNFHAFLSVGFIALAIPIQFEQNIITLCWTIEAVLLFILAIKTRQKEMCYFAIIISFFTLSRLMFIDSQISLTNYSLILNKRFFTFFVVIIASYIIGFLYKEYVNYTEDSNKNFIKLIMGSAFIIANLLTIFIFSQEIIKYHENQIELTQKNISAFEKTHQYDSKQNKNYYATIDAFSAQLTKIDNRSSISLSLFWLTYAIILLIVGFIGKFKTVRVGGIALLILAILKLFFYDLWSLGTLYRIISSICLGVVLLSISFIYQKYKNIIKENLI